MTAHCEQGAEDIFRRHPTVLVTTFALHHTTWQLTDTYWSMSEQLAYDSPGFPAPPGLLQLAILISPLLL